MRDRSEVLKKRRSILLVGTILVAAVPFSGAFAAEQGAPAVTAPAPEWPKWYFYGGLEAGDRFFGDRPGSGFGRAPPPANWLTPVTTQSRAKFEEYGEVRPGAFLDWINLQTGTTDGRYAFDFWGRSVGLNNQSYSLDASELGRHYLSLGWDQTPPSHQHQRQDHRRRRGYELFDRSQFGPGGPASPIAQCGACCSAGGERGSRPNRSY